MNTLKNRFYKNNKKRKKTFFTSVVVTCEKTFTLSTTDSAGLLKASGIETQLDRPFKFSLQSRSHRTKQEHTL